jgi:hypothetical protein
MFRNGGCLFLIFNPLVVLLLLAWCVYGVQHGSNSGASVDRVVDASVRENPASYRPIVETRPVPSSSSGGGGGSGGNGGWNGGK